MERLGRCEVYGNPDKSTVSVKGHGSRGVLRFLRREEEHGFLPSQSWYVHQNPV